MTPRKYISLSSSEWINIGNDGKSLKKPKPHEASSSSSSSSSVVASSLQWLTLDFASIFADYHEHDPDHSSSSSSSGQALLLFEAMAKNYSLLRVSGRGLTTTSTFTSTAAATQVSTSPPPPPCKTTTNARDDAEDAPGGGWLESYAPLLESLWRMNAAGRSYVGRDPARAAKGIQVLSAERHHLTALFYHLRENPLLCTSRKSSGGGDGSGSDQLTIGRPRGNGKRKLAAFSAETTNDGCSISCRKVKR